MGDFADKTATFFQLNGEMVTSYPETGVRLSSMLREEFGARDVKIGCNACLLYTSPSPRDVEESRMPSSA